MLAPGIPEEIGNQRRALIEGIEGVEDMDRPSDILGLKLHSHSHSQDKEKRRKHLVNLHPQMLLLEETQPDKGPIEAVLLSPEAVNSVAN